MSNTILLSPRKSQARQFAALHPIAVSSKAEIQKSIPTTRKDTLWISDDEDKTAQLLRLVAWPTRRLGRAVLLFRPAIETIIALQECFDPIAFGPGRGFLAGSELAEALAAKNAQSLFIGGAVDRDGETVTLWRGNLEPLIVPFSAFPPSADGIAPDFGDFAVIDCGQTVRFGDYEAAADAILYEYDAAYRCEQAKVRLKSERTLGASIRRLRKQRRLRQDDFKPLAAKTIARIERGSVKTVRKSTLAKIAEVLGVRPEEVQTY